MVRTNRVIVKRAACMAMSSIMRAPCKTIESTRACHRVAMAVSSASRATAGGSIYAAARVVGTSAVATRRPASTPPATREQPDTLCCAASSQVRIGSGIMCAKRRSKARRLRHLTVIHSTSRCLAPRGACRATGSATFTDVLRVASFGEILLPPFQRVALGGPLLLARSQLHPTNLAGDRLG